MGVEQSIMERFPASHVHSPTAFTSPEPGELYNNVLAFVAGAPDAPDARRELHIFQCHDVPAHALVEELNALKLVHPASLSVLLFPSARRSSLDLKKIYILT